MSIVDRAEMASYLAVPEHVVESLEVIDWWVNWQVAAVRNGQAQ